jgi:hypothetical protein
MGNLFNRKYRIRFGQSGSPGREINGLRIAFNVERDSDSGANSATIEIWNLAKESVVELERKDCVVTLEAGYGTDIGMVFKGNDILLNQRRELPDVITEIRAGDGGKQIRTQVASIGFEPGALIKDVIKSLVDTFNDVTKSNIDINKLDLGKFSQGFVANGRTKKLLDDILKPRGYQWSIQDGEVRIIQETATSDEMMFVISAKSGLIGSPTKTKNEEKTGLNFTTLLNAGLRPYRRVKLESENVTGIYKIDKVVHRGDSWSGDWITLVECVL